MASAKVKLRLESLYDRITPAAYPTATDPWEWDGLPSDAVVMDDKPPVVDESAAPVGGGEFVSAEASVAAPAPDPAWTIDDVKTELSTNPDAKAILDATIKDGVKIETTSGSGFGGFYDPKNKVLKIDTDASQNPNLNIATSTLLYELLRYKYSREQLDLDKKAKDGTLTKEQYASESEKLSYKYMQEHHKIAEKGVADGSGTRRWTNTRII